MPAMLCENLEFCISKIEYNDDPISQDGPSFELEFHQMPRKQHILDIRHAYGHSHVCMHQDTCTSAASEAILELQLVLLAL
jgi:hypothetical protein